jgi:hypothetical protein
MVDSFSGSCHGDNLGNRKTAPLKPVHCSRLTTQLPLFTTVYSLKAKYYKFLASKP